MIDAAALPADGGKPSAALFDEIAGKLQRDWRSAPLRGDVRALIEYGEKLTRFPASCIRADVDRLRSAGWTDEAIHDAAQVVAYFNYINRIADGLGIDPEPDMRPWVARARE